MCSGVLNPCAPGSNLGDGIIFFFFFFYFLMYLFFCLFLSLLLQCKFANSTLLSLLSFSYYITPYDAQACSAFSALINIMTITKFVRALSKGTVQSYGIVVYNLTELYRIRPTPPTAQAQACVTTSIAFTKSWVYA